MKAPAAQKGDICIILEPSPDEIQLLRNLQIKLQIKFGGQIYEDVHVTCQRFKHKDGYQLPEIINAIEMSLSGISSFPIFADSLFCYYTEFWQTYFLRWKVLQTEEWKAFKSTIEKCLLNMSCPPHYPNDCVTTCSALINVSPQLLKQLIFMENSPSVLFQARSVILSEIESNQKFNIVARYSLL